MHLPPQGCLEAFSTARPALQQTNIPELHLPTNQPCDLFQATDSRENITENFGSWSFNSVLEWKKIWSSKVLRKTEWPFSPLLHLRCQKGLSSEKEHEEGISPVLYSHTLYRRLRPALTFSAISEVRTLEWGRGSEIKRQDESGHQNKNFKTWSPSFKLPKKIASVENIMAWQP